MTETILSEQLGSVLQISINRPERKNALTQAMYTKLASLLNAAATDSTIRVVLLTGKGGVFSSGNDLEDFSKSSSGADILASPVIDFMQALAHFPKPVVASVEGVAVGIGTTLLLHCDLVYAHSEARFCLPFVNLGLTPEYAASLLLPRLAGNVVAAELLMLGDMFSAAEAKQAAIINKVVAEPLVLATAQCQKLAQQPPAALRNTKALLKAPLQQPIEQVIKAELACFSQGLQGDEFKEAVAAFFEKRAADFSSFK